MKRELNFFTDRIGMKIHRASQIHQTGEIIIKDKAQAEILHDSQNKTGDVFSVSAKIRTVGVHISLLFDGRTPKCKDYPEALRRIETEGMVLENPMELPPFFRDMYADIVSKRATF